MRRLLTLAAAAAVKAMGQKLSVALAELAAEELAETLEPTLSPVIPVRMVLAVAAAVPVKRQLLQAELAARAVTALSSSAMR